MNDMLASECSSGCESGWTLLLEHSFLSPPYPSHGGGAHELVDGRSVHTHSDENEEEDLSMVSDASSGPPVFHEDEYYGNADNGFFYHPPIEPTLPNNSGKRKKIKENRRRNDEEHPSFLDDTASSPIFNLSSQKNFTLTTATNNNNNKASSMEKILEFSEGCSATHFEIILLQGRSAFHEPFGFFQSPLSANQLQQNQWFGGKMGMR
ncbi:uncharacterized protein LOC114269359 isoform X1 [Camellia sinensis]|uniref:uncharacterized protein LOC114269359 isoform X1 n=1 Tax=Camellia sinensis TaxID=4442 RepID=UPI00103610BC|nr:uncharacterized protein LOC114269359 isoform X1 [Camellia sinensis]